VEFSPVAARRFKRVEMDGSKLANSISVHRFLRNATVPMAYRATPAL